MATTNTVNANVTVKFVVNEKGNPPGKLADAQLHFSTHLAEDGQGASGEAPSMNE